MSMIAFILSFLISTIPAPTRVDDPECELPWFKGAEPPTPHNTVLVFVHGKHDDEQIWFDNVYHYGHNDMYEMAYNAGYRTAFVRLGSEATMWYNGRVLSEQLASIERHFNTRNIVIVAHSKGGIDAQTALVYYNSLGAPRKIISLSTPYYGSPLADLVFSNFYTAWLALIIGQATPATFVLQTGYMYDFQDRLSDDPDNQYLYYYTLSGWDIGPFPLWLGGLYLNMHGGDYRSGGNDGAVTFQSAHLLAPHAERISLPAYEDRERQWFFNHFNMRLGQNTWYYIDSLLNVYPVLTAYNSNKNSLKREGYVTLRSTGFIRSSAIDKNAPLNIIIPEGAYLYLLINKNAKVSLSGVTMQNKLKDYPGTPIKYLSVKTDRSQQLRVNGEYFLMVDEEQNPLEIEYQPVVKNTPSHIRIRLTGQVQSISYKITARVYSLTGNIKRVIELDGNVRNGSYVTLPFFEEGLYNVSLIVNSGTIERTAIFSMVVKEEHSFNHRNANIQTAYLKRVENTNREGIVFDILGRYGKNIQKSGVFFKRIGEKNKPVIVIK